MAAILGSGAAASGLTLSMLSAARAWAGSSGPGSEETALASMARLLCPHDVPDSVYTRTMDSVLSAAAADSSLRSALDQALSELDAAAGGDFAAADPKTRITALQGMENQPYFEAIRGQLLARVYNDPVIWEHIGYPGSSVQYGGYKDRGFNDIDWLPADD